MAVVYHYFAAEPAEPGAFCMLARLH